jgi:serine/threonine-protein kinase
VAVTHASSGTLTLGHYRLDAELGRGGMGIVFRAVDLRLGRPVALKVVHRSVAEAAGLPVAELQARLKHEAQLAARILHPHVVTVFAYDEVGDDALIAMELVEGHTLADLLARGCRWAPHDAARLLAQAADGVAAAHALGIVHRDLKPGNLILTADGRCKVLDFGIAKATSADFAPAVSRTTFGTVQYMAPEQVLGRPVSAATDVWALGAIAYELVVGAPAFGDGAAVTIGMRVAGEEPPYLADASLAEQVFGVLAPVVWQSLRKRPEERFPHAAALRDALVGTLQHAVPEGASAVAGAVPVAGETGIASAGGAMELVGAPPSGRVAVTPSGTDSPVTGSRPGAPGRASTDASERLTPAATGGAVATPTTGGRTPSPPARRAAMALMGMLVVFSGAGAVYLLSEPERTVSTVIAGGEAAAATDGGAATDALPSERNEPVMPTSTSGTWADAASTPPASAEGPPSRGTTGASQITAQGNGPRGAREPGGGSASGVRTEATATQRGAAGTPARGTPPSLGQQGPSAAVGAPERRAPPRVVVGRSTLSLEVGQTDYVPWQYEFDAAQALRVEWRVREGSSAESLGDGRFRARSSGTTQFVPVTIGPNGDEVSGAVVSVTVRERAAPAAQAVVAVPSMGDSSAPPSPRPAAAPVREDEIEAIIKQALQRIPETDKPWSALAGYPVPDFTVDKMTFSRTGKFVSATVEPPDAKGITRFEARASLAYEFGAGLRRSRELVLRGTAVRDPAGQRVKVTVSGHELGKAR